MKGVWAFLVAMVAFLTVFQVGSMLPVDEAEASQFVDAFKDLVKDIDAIGIFIHNTTIALPMILPGLGPFWALFSAWSTGYAFAAIVSVTPELDGILALSILATPFGIMEITAYSIGLSRSILLTLAVIKKTPIISQLKSTAIEVGVITGLLFVAAFIEMWMIEMLENTPNEV